MSSPSSSQDPRTGRDRRIVTRRRTFKSDTVDPVIEHRRPLLTWGNAILAALLIGFALYATGNLPQLDAFFVHIDQIGRSHNNAAVSTIIAIAPYLFGGLVLAAICLFVFLFVNSSRRQHSDPKGWEKTVDLPPNRRSISRRMADLPSMIMPIGKDRRSPGGRVPTPAATPAVPQTPAPKATPTPAATSPNPAKAAAIAAAARAEAALETTPADLPSFVRPLGKGPVAPPPAAPPAPAVAAPQNTAANTAKLEAALAAAKAAAAKAEADIAAAKLEAALAAAKSEAAAAEAALAAAKADAAS